nr:hypothetical protein [Tanacetum cinerariifolium]
MVAILEKGEFNSNFHPMVDFVAASPLRIETTDEGTHILATVDGIQRTVFESSLRRNLKLRDKDGIVSILDTKLFENLTLMGYNISPNQKHTFQKGQFAHDAPIKGRIINEGETAVERISNDSEEVARVLTSMDAATVLAGGIDVPTGSDEPASHQRDVSQREACPTDSGFIADQDRETIDKSSTLLHDSAPRITSPAAVEGSIQQTIPELTALYKPASPVRDDSQREACLTDSSFIADQDKATVAKSSTLPRDSAPRVTSPAAEEGSMQHTLNELTTFCTSLQRQHSELLAKFQAQEFILVYVLLHANYHSTGSSDMDQVI